MWNEAGVAPTRIGFPAPFNPGGFKKCLQCPGARFGQLPCGRKFQLFGQGIGICLKHPQGISDLHPAKLGAPAVKRRLADVVVGAHRLYRRVTFGFPENPDDLFFAVLALSHSSAAFLFAAELSFCHVQFLGVGSLRRPDRPEIGGSWNSPLRTKKLPMDFQPQKLVRCVRHHVG